MWDTWFKILFSIYAFQVEFDLNTFDAGLMHDEVCESVLQNNTFVFLCEMWTVTTKKV